MFDQGTRVASYATVGSSERPAAAAAAAAYMLVADGGDDDVCAVGMSDAIIGDGGGGGETFAPDDDLQLPCRPHAISPHPPLLPHRRRSTPKYWGHVPSPSLPYPHFLLLFPFPLLPTSLPLFSPALPLQVGALNTARESGGSAVSSPSGVWGGATAESEFCAF